MRFIRLSGFIIALLAVLSQFSACTSDSPDREDVIGLRFLDLHSVEYNGKKYYDFGADLAGDTTYWTLESSQVQYKTLGLAANNLRKRFWIYTGRSRDRYLSVRCGKDDDKDPCWLEMDLDFWLRDCPSGPDIVSSVFNGVITVKADGTVPKTIEYGDTVGLNDLAEMGRCFPFCGEGKAVLSGFSVTLLNSQYPMLRLVLPVYSDGENFFFLIRKAFFAEIKDESLLDCFKA